MSNSKSSTTRSTTYKYIVTSTGIKHKFGQKDKFNGPPYKLPTLGDVVERILSEKTWRTRTAASKVADELYQLWAVKCNVYPISTQGITKKICTAIDEFSS